MGKIFTVEVIEGTNFIFNSLLNYLIVATPIFIYQRYLIQGREKLYIAWLFKQSCLKWTWKTSHDFDTAYASVSYLTKLTVIFASC